MLKICNWPETTSCISDLLVVRKSDRQQVAGSSQFSKDIAAALRNAATEVGYNKMSFSNLTLIVMEMLIQEQSVKQFFA